MSVGKPKFIVLMKNDKKTENTSEQSLILAEVLDCKILGISHFSNTFL